MSENSTLRIHATLRPHVEEVPRQPIKIEPAKAQRSKHHRVKPRMTHTDRLLRNSALACAMLLGVLALGNVDQPWAKKASDTVEKALTMRIDLDESIGALEFVRNVMPESALVFMNLSERTALEKPIDGPVAHAWSSLQPWVMFNCGENTPVKAISSGTVTAVSPLSDGRYGLLVDHGEGLESLYANLGEVTVASGDAVARGQQMGACDAGLYFELRQGGEAVDPTERLGL